VSDTGYAQQRVIIMIKHLRNNKKMGRNFSTYTRIEKGD
jgi:hypothetical protein